MTVVQGNVALVSDYNTLRTEINRWFADNYPSLSFGDNSQRYGWGGSEIVAPSTLMIASEMNRLVDRCNIGKDVVNNVSIETPQIVTGNTPTAAEFNYIEAKSDGINYYKHDIESGELSLHTGGSSARSSTWSSAIDYTFEYSITDFRRFRYFWNSGGAINITADVRWYSTGSGWDGAGFDSLFTSMGTVLMDYTRTTQSGSGGTTTTIGYYDLTTSYQTIFSQSGTGSYTDATLLIEAKHALSGALVRVRVTLTPGAASFVDGTTTLTTQYRKLDDQLAYPTVSLIIAAPSYSIVDGL